MSDEILSDELVTLCRCDDLVAAQLLCGRLDAEGIECLIPDEHVANQTWHLSRAIGGIRVQVRSRDLARAQEVIATPHAQEAMAEAVPGSPVGPDGDDGSISAGDRAGYRALRVALVSLWLLGLLHPYSLWLAASALGRPDITIWGRRRAWVALLVSLAGCLSVALLVSRFLGWHHR